MLKVLKGVYGGGDPPLPIPNREVKPARADGTASRWESRSMPDSGGDRVEETRSPLFFHTAGLSSFNRFAYLGLFKRS